MNQNIARIIAFLQARKRSRRLCSVGLKRLKWWLKDGRRFKSVKAALSTWTAQEIKDWFDYAGIDQDIAGRNAKERHAYWGAEEFLDNIGVDSWVNDRMTPELEQARLAFTKRVQKWMEVTAKANFLRLSERDLIGNAGDAPDTW